jgi:hypothetical protein
MILSHPSAMRKGAYLESRVRAGPVIKDNRLSPTTYNAGFLDLFTLPRLSNAASENGHDVDDEPWATSLAATGVVESAALDVTRRVACLSSSGVVLLVQKLVNSDTRHAIRLDTVENVMALKLEEIEQLQTWCEEIAAPRVEAGTPLADALQDAAVSFEETLIPLRELLKDPVRRGEAWRQVADARRERRP